MSNYAKHYTKKPVTITAMQFDGSTASAQAICEWAETKGVKNVEYVLEGEAPELVCNTLEGPLVVSPDDFVIRGIKGEYYPCKPDIFEATYNEGEAGVELVPDVAKQLRDAIYESISAAGHSLPDNSSGYASPGEIVDMAIKKTRGEDYSTAPSEPLGTPTEGLSFGEALSAMEDGENVAREGWNGKGMFIYHVRDGEAGSNIMQGDGTPEPYRDYDQHIVMFTADGKHVPWLCSQTDMLANDWCIVPIGI